MGRKATDKQRKDNPGRKREWAEELAPFFYHRGIKGVTMDDVAVQLGKSKATIYKYFRSQEEILDISLNITLEKIAGFIPILADADKSYHDRYYQGVEHLSLHIGNISSLFLRDVQELFPAIWQKIRDFMEMATQILREFYESGIRDGVFRDIHTGLLVLSDRFLFNALTDPSFLEEHQLSLQEAFSEYFRMKFYGLMKKS